nr:hypothetical protein GCM10020092_096140 [Actinoplanes digitatis]
MSWELLWAARGRVSAELDHTVRIERRLKAALRLIGRYGLADLDPPGESMLVHPLVRGMVGQQLSSERHAALQRSVRAMLAAADLGDPDNPAHWPRYSAIVAHLVHADVLGGEAEEIRQLVINCIRFLYARGDWDSSRELAAQAVARWRDDLGEADEQTLLASFHLANALRSVGRTADARDLNARTLRAQREVLGADDETTLATANSVGADLRMQGHFGQARQLDADNLVRYRRLFGESFPTALRCANNLAVDLRLLGDFRGARALDEQVLRHRQMIFVEGHPETLSSRAGLAFDLLGMGDYTGATEVLNGGHAEALGPGHPMALWVEPVRGDRGPALRPAAGTGARRGQRRAVPAAARRPERRDARRGGVAGELRLGGRRPRRGAAAAGARRGRLPGGAGRRAPVHAGRGDQPGRRRARRRAGSRRHARWTRRRSAGCGAASAPTTRSR